ncbi:hypothetical protein EXD72_27610, partial [Klebsiella pneumoniae]
RHHPVPFGVGAAPQLLAQIAPGVVWVAALLAALAWRSGRRSSSALVLSDRHHPVPFGVGAAPQLLAQIAPGVVWVAALLAAL